MRALKAESLNGALSLPGKIKGDPAKLTPPTRRRTPLTLSRKANDSWSESDNSLVRGKSRNEPLLTWRRAAMSVPVMGSRTSRSIVKACPFVIPAAREKQGGRQMVGEMPEIAAAILAQFAQELP